LEAVKITTQRATKYDQYKTSENILEQGIWYWTKLESSLSKLVDSV